MKREVLGAAQPDDATLREQIEVLEDVAAALQADGTVSVPWDDARRFRAFMRDALPALLARAQPPALTEEERLLLVAERDWLGRLIGEVSAGQRILAIIDRLTSV